MEFKKGLMKQLQRIITDLKPKPNNKKFKSPDRMVVAERRLSNMVEKGQIKTTPGYGREVATIGASVKPRKNRLSKKTQKPVYGRMQKSMNPDKFKNIENKVKKSDIRKAATKIIAGTGSAAVIAALLLGKDEDKSSSVTIKKGDTLSQIAKANGTTLKALKESNPNIKDLNKISIGQKINLSPKVKNRKSVYQGMSKSDMASISKNKSPEVVARKYGGQIGRPRGVGAALRGYGKGYK